MSANEIAVLEEEISAVYERFPGLEEIYPRDKVSSASVINIKGIKAITPKCNVPGVLVLPCSKGHAGERLDVDDKGIIGRQIGLGESFINKYDLLEAIRRFSPASPTAYAVLIQGRNLTVFYNSI